MQAIPDRTFTSGFGRAVSGVSVPSGYALSGSTGVPVPWLPASANREAESGAPLPPNYDPATSPGDFDSGGYVFVTPALARQWLALPPATGEDRPLDEPRWHGYARDMAWFRWYSSPSTPIQLSRDGTKRHNGRHRLRAIIRAAELNPAFTGLWCFVVHSDEYRGVDTGKPRSMPHSYQVGHQGHVQYMTDIAAVTKWALSLDAGEIVPGRRVFWTHPEQIDYISEYQDLLSKAVQRGRRARGALKDAHRVRVEGTALGVAYFLITRDASPARVAKCDEFFIWLTSRTLSGSMDVKAEFLKFADAAEWVTCDTGVARTTTRDDRLAAVLSAWLAYEKNEEGKKNKPIRIPAVWSVSNWPGRELRRPRADRVAA